MVQKNFENASLHNDIKDAYFFMVENEIANCTISNMIDF